MSGFQDIIGHEQIIEHLQNAIRMNKVSHAYIFNGPEKSGKMMLAEAFALALQCEKGEADGCTVCHECKQVLSHNHPDVVYLHHEKPNTISVDDIRKQINHDIAIKPYSGRYKIYIVDEAEKMNSNAQNALLKTLEEPPAYAVILLLSNNADNFLPTIQSRCIRLNLMPVADSLIREHLMKNFKIPDYQVDISLEFAQGNVGKAVELASSENFQELKDSVIQLMKRVKEINLYEMSEAVKQISEYKLSINDYFDIMMVWYRDVLMYKATLDINSLIFKDQAYEIKRQASLSSYHGIEKIMKSLEKAKIRLNANVNFELVIELLLITIKEN